MTAPDQCLLRVIHVILAIAARPVRPESGHSANARFLIRALIRLVRELRGVRTRQRCRRRFQRSQAVAASPICGRPTPFWQRRTNVWRR